MKILSRFLVMNLVMLMVSACSDPQFSKVENGSFEEPEEPEEPVGQKGPSILILQAPKGDLSIFDELAVEYQVVAGTSPIATIDCQWNGITLPCPKDRDRLVLPGGKVGGHKFEIVAKDANGLEDRKILPWKLFDKFKKHKTPFQVQGKNDQVDILFVIDNSDSMDEEQAQMAQRFSSFIDRVRTLDWNIGIVTTTPSHNTHGDGRLLQFPNGQYFLTSKLNVDAVRDYFGKTIQRSENGSNTEEGIRATARAIQRYAKPKEAIDQYHKNFFRDNASLSVVVVSDEDESSGAPINKGSELLKLVDTTWSSKKKFQFHSIIARPGDRECLNGNGMTAGYFYADLTLATEGILGNICESDYGSQLSAIGQSVANTQKTYDLDCAPKDLNSDGNPDVLVKEAGGSTVPNFVVSGDKIIFSQPPGVGQYIVEYYCPSK